MTFDVKTKDYNSNVLFSRIPDMVVIYNIFCYIPVDITTASLVSARTREYFIFLVKDLVVTRKLNIPAFPFSTYLDIYAFEQLPSLYAKRSAVFTTYEKEHDFITACSHGDMGSVRRILGEGVDIDCLDSTRFEAIDSAMDLQRNLSPIEYAAIEGHKDIVSFLLDHGARYDRTKGVDEIDNSTIFDIVADHGLTDRRIECLKLICAKMVEDSNYIPFYWCYRIVVPSDDTNVLLKEVIQPNVKVGTCIEIEGHCGSCYTDINKGLTKLYYKGSNLFTCHKCSALSSSQ